MSVKIKACLRLSGALLAVAMPGAALAQSTSIGASPDQPYEETVFFGDSLTDSGYFRPLLPASVRPVTGQFVDNPNWVWSQFLADYYGTAANPNGNGQTGTNYAAGGSRNGINSTGALGPIPSLATQVSNYLTARGGRANSNALYSVWGGANDLFSIVNAGAPEAATISASVAAQVANVSALRNAGAQYVLLFNTPDLGNTPAFLALGAAASANGTRLSLAYNSAMVTAMASAGHTVIPIDAYSLFREVVANPAAYGFSNITGTLCQPQITANSLTCNPTSTILPVPNTTHLFADGVHPTSRAHRILAQHVAAVLEAPRLMAVLPNSAKVIGRSRADAVSAQGGDPGEAGTRVWVDLRLNMPGADANLDPRGARPAVVLGLGRSNGQFSYGLFGGWSEVRQNFRLAQGEFRQKDAAVGGYVAWRGDNLWLNAQASYTWLDIETNRNITLGATSRSHSGSTNGRNITLAANAGYAFQTGNLRHGPNLGVLSQMIRIDAFDENQPGLSSALGYGQQSYDSVVGRVGYQLELTSSESVQPYVQASYEREFGDYPSEAIARSLSVTGSLPFAVPGISYDRDYGIVAGGLRAKVGPGRLDLGASTTFGQSAGRDGTVYVRYGVGF